jgi:signal transduction histidine kinase
MGPEQQGVPIVVGPQESYALLEQLNRDLETRVAERTRQLETANRELEAFSYSVSHDLRAPLRALDGFAQALLEDYGDRLDGEGRHMLERIRAASQRMGHLIDDMLRLSRVHRAELRLAPVDLSALVSGLCAAAAEREPFRRIEFHVEPGMVVQADAPLLTLALQNLIDNAVKFTRGRDQAVIHVGAVAAEPGWWFIRDNGVGFDPRFSDQLFNPFQRLHSASDFEGSGVGLATVRRVIVRHGGAIRGESTLGEGAVFYFTLQHGEGP